MVHSIGMSFYLTLFRSLRLGKCQVCEDYIPTYLKVYLMFVLGEDPYLRCTCTGK